MKNHETTRHDEQGILRAPHVGQLIQVMQQAHGQDLAMFDEAFLAKSLGRRLATSAPGGINAYLRRLAGDRTEADALFQSLHIGYSEFFRDSLVFAMLEQDLLPSLLLKKEQSDRTTLRVWSAGCAGGQEAWSVAMLLDELATARSDPVLFQIFATDGSTAGLHVALQGVYASAAVQNVRLKHLRKYFTVDNGDYAINPILKKRVAFSVYDLLDGQSVCPPVSLFGDFDLILCCNLLFYYRADVRQFILDKLCNALAPGGYIVTGSVERAIAQKNDRLCAVAPPLPVYRERSKPCNGKT